jgi:hypothetical protein
MNDENISDIIYIAKINKRSKVLKFIIETLLPEKNDIHAYTTLHDAGIKLHQLDSNLIKWIFATYPAVLETLTHQYPKTLEIIQKQMAKN